MSVGPVQHRTALQTWALRAQLLVAVLIPALLVAVPTRLLEQGPSLCIPSALIGRPCPGCGMTRAISAALHADFGAAWAHNKLSVVVLPVLLLVWFAWIRRLVHQLRGSPVTLDLVR